MILVLAGVGTFVVVCLFGIGLITMIRELTDRE